MSTKRVIFHLIFVVFAIAIFNTLEVYAQELEHLNKKGSHLLIAFIWWSGNMLDIVTTLILAKLVGSNNELNAVAHSFMKRFGNANGLLFFKLMIISIVLLLDIMAPTRSLLLMCSLIVWIVALSNTINILRLQAQKNPLRTIQKHNRHKS